LVANRDALDRYANTASVTPACGIEVAPCFTFEEIGNSPVDVGSPAGDTEQRVPGFACFGPDGPAHGWPMLDTMRDAAQRRGIDPYLVAAVVREESSYYPRATSPVGARGLMQLMPSTARLMVPTGDLEDPGFNIELGTRFLAGLIREFNDPRLALAAYNAGPTRVRQWLSTRRSDDMEAFVEQIPFDETRLYVKKVVLSWDEYRRIYGSP